MGARQQALARLAVARPGQLSSVIMFMSFCTGRYLLLVYCSCWYALRAHSVKFIGLFQRKSLWSKHAISTHVEGYANASFVRGSNKKRWQNLRPIGADCAELRLGSAGMTAPRGSSRCNLQLQQTSSCFCRHSCSASTRHLPRETRAWSSNCRGFEGGDNAANVTRQQLLSACGPCEHHRDVMRRTGSSITAPLWPRDPVYN